MSWWARIGGRAALLLLRNYSTLVIFVVEGVGARISRETREEYRKNVARFEELPTIPEGTRGPDGGSWRNGHYYHGCSATPMLPEEDE